MKWVSPIYLATIFGFFCWFNVPDYVRTIIGGDGTPPDQVALYSWGLIVATVTLLLVGGESWRRGWRAGGMDGRPSAARETRGARHDAAGWVLMVVSVGFVWGL